MANWTVSDRLTEFIAVLFEDVGAGTPGVPYYPSIMWSTGGSVSRPGMPDVPLPARYTLGWVDQPSIGNYSSIADKRFGRIVFLPRPEDEASTRRLIDFDGTDIVVR